MLESVCARAEGTGSRGCWGVGTPTGVLVGVWAEGMRPPGLLRVPRPARMGTERTGPRPFGGPRSLPGCGLRPTEAVLPAVPPRFRCHGGSSAAATAGAGAGAAAGRQQDGDVRRHGTMSGCAWGAAPPLLEALGRLWEVQAPLGSGSSASVYRVRCCGDPRAPPGAVKEFVLPPGPRPGPARRPGARPPGADCAEYGFRKERAALEQLRGHRNIGNGTPASRSAPCSLGTPCSDPQTFLLGHPVSLEHPPGQPPTARLVSPNYPPSQGKELPTPLGIQADSLPNAPPGQCAPRIGIFGWADLRARSLDIPRQLPLQWVLLGTSPLPWVGDLQVTIPRVGRRDRQSGSLEAGHPGILLWAGCQSPSKDCVPCGTAVKVCSHWAAAPGLPSWVGMSLGKGEACVSEVIAGSAEVHTPLILLSAQNAF